MPGFVLNRNRLLGVALTVAIGGFLALWFYQIDRQLRRSWTSLLDAVEARNTARLGRLLADDYHDRWGYDRRTILNDARLAFFQFRRLELTAEQVRITRDGDAATITAVLRMDAEGAGQVSDARATVNGLFTPFTFQWRRESGLTGRWKLVSFDHPELELARFRRGW